MILTLAFPFLIAALLEVGLRVANYGGDLSAFRAAAGGVYRVPNARLGMRYFSGGGFAPSPSRDAFLARKPAHSLRIFVLGESSAAGFPYPPNGTFSRVLDDALSDVLPHDTVEVVNMGLAATNSYAIADLAGDIIDQKPDAVIIYGGHNEYYGALGAASTGLLGRFPSLVRGYLAIDRLRTIRLLRNTVAAGLRAARGRQSPAAGEADPSRLEDVVVGQGIPLGGVTYRNGVNQYTSNLRVALYAFRGAGIPVFIGSAPSNLRDLTPFGAFAVPPDSAATIVFDSARKVLAGGDSVHAGAMFARARDLDVIRFRAPSAFQRVVQSVAAETGATYVPVAEGIAAASRYRIPGSDLFLEHVHLTQRGYVLIASIYFDALRRSRYLGRAADSTRFSGWDDYMSRMHLTAFDQRVAYHTVRAVTARWPFVSASRQQSYRLSYKPVTFVDSLAFQVAGGELPWAKAKAVLAARYGETAHPDSARAEYAGLVRDGAGSAPAGTPRR